MPIFRIESNVETGEVSRIDQQAYRSDIDPDQVAVLDASEPPPKGFTAFDPEGT